MAGVLGRLYSGTGALDVVGRRRIWYSISGVLVVVCLASILLRGFNLGIDFVTATCAERATQQGSALCEHTCIALTQLLEQMRGSIDVSKEQRDGSLR